MRESILNGTLQQDEKLPSTRELSINLNVSRNVVIESYEQLVAEGYAYTLDGSGTYISRGALLAKKPTISYSTLDVTKKPDISTKNDFCFRTGIPDLSCIPIKKWGQMYKDISSSIYTSKMDYQTSFGEYGLRCELSSYLNRIRGINTSPNNIIITSGAAQAFSLLCKIIGKEEFAVVENPLSNGILHTLISNEVNIHPIPVDNCGMITSCLPEIPAKLIFTTPSHQFPTGVIMPISRRIELLQYAKEHDAFIVEDDYDSEFRFSGDPIQSMHHLDPSRVIYVGTFSKTLMPALRIGYMILPDSVRIQLKEAKYTADIHSPTLEQLTLQKFIETGHFHRHIRKMKNIYIQKRNLLIKCLNDTFGDKVVLSGADAGLHFVASFQEICFTDALMQKITEEGIQISSINKHYILPYSDDLYNHSLIFGYGNTKIDSIQPGINNLYEIMMKH